MASGPPTDAPLMDWLESSAADEPRPALDIEIDEAHATLRVYDPRLFRAGRRAFCERLLRAAAREQGVERAHVDLFSSSCVISFNKSVGQGSAMAEGFVRAVREAGGGTDDDALPRLRRPRPWSSLAALRLADGPSLWEVSEAEAGRVQLRRDALRGGRAELARLADRLAGMEGVEACRVSLWSRVVTVQRGPDGPRADALLEAVERLLRDTPADPLPSTPEAGELAVGWRRLAYLGMAGCSFGLTLVGLVIPGVPTVPFLLATGYYLARSSPGLNDRLRRAAFFGPILREAEDHEALSLASKGKLTALTLATVTVTVLVAPITPVLLAVIVAASSVSLYGVAQAPALDGPSEGGRLPLALTTS